MKKRPLEFYGEPLAGVDISELQGRLIVLEGPDSVGRSTQVARLRAWLENQGHAVIDTGLARSQLAGRGIARAKRGNTFGPLTMTLFYATDFADRLENEIIPALRAGFVVLTDRYIFSVMARGISRGEDRRWLERLSGFALVPHAVYYLRANVHDLVSRVVLGRGRFDYWESGMDLRFGTDMCESFVRYQSRVIRTLDRMAKKYDFVTVDASRHPDEIETELRRHISALFPPVKTKRKKLSKLVKAAGTDQGDHPLNAVLGLDALAAQSKPLRRGPKPAPVPFDEEDPDAPDDDNDATEESAEDLGAVRTDDRQEPVETGDR